MPLVQFNELLGGLRPLGREADGAPQIAVESRRHLFGSHSVQFKGVAHVINGHVFLVAVFPWSSEDIHFIVLLGVGFILARRKDSHTPVDTLTASAAMPASF